MIQKKVNKFVAEYKLQKDTTYNNIDELVAILEKGLCKCSLPFFNPQQHLKELLILELEKEGFKVNPENGQVSN